MKTEDKYEVMTLYNQMLSGLYLEAACEIPESKESVFFVGYTFIYDVFIIYNHRKRVFDRLECWDTDQLIEEVIKL